METKICCVCHVEKPKSEYGINRALKDGLLSYCKPCGKERNTRYHQEHPDRKRASSRKWREKFLNSGDPEKAAKFRAKAAEVAREWRAKNPERAADLCARWRYKIPIGTYDKLFEAQNGKCAICGREDANWKREGSKMNRFHVDHCHETGIVRGLLCHGCNVSIGHFNHDRKILLSAIDYLDNSGTGT